MIYARCMVAHFVSDKIYHLDLDPELLGTALQRVINGGQTASIPTETSQFNHFDASNHFGVIGDQNARILA